MMVTSRTSLEGLMQNRLTPATHVICAQDTLRVVQGNTADLFRLYTGKHHVDDISYAETMVAAATATIKREVHTPTTDQSEDSGVDMSAAAAYCGDSGRGGLYKRKRSDADDDDVDDEADDDVDDHRRHHHRRRHQYHRHFHGRSPPPTTVQEPNGGTTDGATATVLSVNMAVLGGNGEKTTASAGCTPFRPWSSDESSSSDVNLRLFHDIRNVDRILTLTQNHRRDPLPPPPPVLPELQPLDLTSGRKNRATDIAPVEERAVERRVVPATAAPNVTTGIPTFAARPTVTTVLPTVTAVPTVTPIPTVTAVPTVAAIPTTASGTVTGPATRYSKNMSRARRIEANARERSRVHTISAAFDTLRSAIPSYSKNQKLSKLSTIRIASAYILTLSRMLDRDYSAEQDAPSVDECVNNITGIIHMEGKAKKRKDEQQ